MHDHDALPDKEHDRREIDSHDSGSGAHADQHRAPRIHRVCVTCNNMFETDPGHLDVKYCPACRRA